MSDKKYHNHDPDCTYPFSNDVVGYCWSYANHVDGTKCFENIKEHCMLCDYYKKSEKYCEGGIK